jgi:hypothetical protein
LHSVANTSQVANDQNDVWCMKCSWFWIWPAIYMNTMIYTNYTSYIKCWDLHACIIYQFTLGIFFTKLSKQKVFRFVISLIFCMMNDRNYECLLRNSELAFYLLYNFYGEHYWPLLSSVNISHFAFLNPRTSLLALLHSVVITHCNFSLSEHFSISTTHSLFITHFTFIIPWTFLTEHFFTQWILIIEEHFILDHVLLNNNYSVKITR